MQKKHRTWKEVAVEVIQRVMRENPDVEREELLKRVDAAYPFGMREYYPYKAWLQARRELVLGEVPPPKVRPFHEPKPSIASQLYAAGVPDLFSLLDQPLEVTA